MGLIAVQGTLKSLLQHHSSKASILRCSAFLIVQLSHPYMTTGKTTALTRHHYRANQFLPHSYVSVPITYVIIFLGSKITADGDCSHEIKRLILLGRKDDQPRQHIKKQRHYFANKCLSSQSYGFSSSHVCI